MANQPDYTCTNEECRKPTAREDLTVKKVVFLEMGVGGATKRSRVVGWLCPSCTVKDDAWTMEAFRAPGNKPAVMRPVRG